MDSLLTRGGNRSPRKAFTLIELLIVIAIILILISITLPNFIRARTRARLTDALSGMKTVVAALEAYYSQYDRYINPYFPNYPEPESMHMFMAFLGIEGINDSGNPYPPHHNIGQQLTTPNQFLTELPRAPFWSALLQSDSLENGQIHNYSDVETFVDQGKVFWASFPFSTNIGNNPNINPPMWASNIPVVPVFHIRYFMLSIGPNLEIDQGSFVNANIYDPTNGLYSYGDITYLAPYGFMGNGHWVGRRQLNYNY